MIPKPDIDTTIDDIHRTRERLAEQFGGNIKAILDDARRRQATSGHPLWNAASAGNTIPLGGHEMVSGNAQSSTAEG